MIHQLTDAMDPEIEISSDSDEIDEDQAMRDLLKLENGREFMSFVQ